MILDKSMLNTIASDAFFFPLSVLNKSNSNPKAKRLVDTATKEIAMEYNPMVSVSMNFQIIHKDTKFNN